MANFKYAVSLLMTIALIPAYAFGSEPPKVVVKGKHDASTVVVKGVRDPSAWFRIESQHLVVYSNDDPDDVIELVNNLERLDAVLRLYLKPFLDGHEALPKLTLYFQARPDLPPEIGAVDGSTASLTSRCASGTLAFTFGQAKSWKLDNASLLRPEDDYTLMTNFVVYADTFLYRHTRIRAPAWFLTGFDAYFGGMRFTDDQMLVGRDAGTSYNLLQEIDEGRIRRLRFDDVLHDRTPPGTFKVGTNGYYRQWEFLARSFNLVHYMLSSEENRDRMGKYLERVNEGADPADAFADLFGLSGQELDAAMWRYRQASMHILQVDVPERPSPTVEAVAYFVASEALTNAVRHARATQVRIVVTRFGDLLRMTITDDGAGGAEPSRGTGLTGLRQRVGSVDGTFRISSPAGGPTVITVELPCAS